jgi:glutamate racemase
MDHHAASRLVMTAPNRAPIGVFDSGIGGLSVLQSLLTALPHEHFVYLADNGHAPYGEKTDLFVRQFTSCAHTTRIWS